MRDLFMNIILKMVDALVTDEVIDMAKAALIDWMRQLAQSTDNQLDDKIVEIFAKAIEADNA